MAIIVNPVRDINFPEFTSSLIQGVFETIQNNHLIQIKSYSELLKATAESLETFTSNNYLSVPDESVYEFLNRPIELITVPTASGTTYLTIDEWVKASSTPPDLLDLDTDSYTSLNEFLSLEDSTKQIKDSSTVDDLMTAIRKKIASENYYSLKEMVKMGMLRIVSDKITIKTRLTFNSQTYSKDTSNASETNYGSKGFNIGGNASYRRLPFGINLAAGYKKVSTTVNTTNQSSINTSSANLNLFGYVKIEARTDYQSISE